MAGTLRRSLECILNQVTAEFEVLVVDGGSTDRSREILRDLASEYDQLRIEERPADPNRHLGADRQYSFEAAKGKYVLHHLDTDDVFDDVILDLVDIYHQIEDAVDRRFAMLAGGLNIAPRTLLLDVSYRNLGGAEDEDFWRRLYSKDALIWLEMDSIAEEIGRGKSLKGTLRRWYTAQVADFQVNISFWSYVAFLIRASLHEDVYDFDFTPKQVAFKLAILPVTYVVANVWRESYETPPEFSWRGDRHRHTYRTRVTVDKLRSLYGIDVETDHLSERARESLCARR